ncbi:MAG: hypothetical protein WKF32_00320 [Thermoleophilaceae bacterium]
MESSTSPMRALAVTVPTTLPVSQGGVSERLTGASRISRRVQAKDETAR